MDVYLVIDKIKTAYELKTNSELAKQLKITPAAIDAWKRYKKVPDKYIFQCITDTGVSMEWLTSEDKPTFQISGGSKNPTKNGYTLTLDLTKEQIEKLENIAKGTGITPEQLTRLALFKNEYIS